MTWGNAVIWTDDSHQLWTIDGARSVRMMEAAASVAVKDCGECSQPIEPDEQRQRVTSGRFIDGDEELHLECYIDRCAQRALERLAR